MAGPLLPTSLAIGEVVETRIMAVWRDQEFITKFYWRVYADVGTAITYTSTIAGLMQVNWQAAFAPLLPPEFVVRQYWAAIILNITRAVLPPFPTRIYYLEPSIVLGNEDDVGTLEGEDWLPTTDAATMNRFGSIRTKNWRSNVRFGPIPESGQNSGLLEDAEIVSLNTAFTLFAFGDLLPPASSTVQLKPVLFSPVLGVAQAFLTMDQASQDIVEWRASRLIGTQRTRKIRAAGY